MTDSYPTRAFVWRASRLAMLVQWAATLVKRTNGDQRSLTMSYFTMWPSNLCTSLTMVARSAS